MIETIIRGDQTVDLGSKGKFVCRPSLRALQAIDRYEPLNVLLTRFMIGQSLNDTIEVIYHAHLEGLSDPKQALSREEIGSACLEVGMDRLRLHCSGLIASAFAPSDDKRDKAGEGNSGNEGRAESMETPPGSAETSS